MVALSVSLQAAALALLAFRVGSSQNYFATAFVPLLLDGVAK